MTAISLHVNGRIVIRNGEPRQHLADYLREDLHLTGTHLGCEHGVCGACTLLLNGEPVRSCITYAVSCAGKSVTSIEGLQDDPVMGALRTAFSAEHALQCGYCTPGMLVTARDIVRRLPDADDDRIRLELSGNLCRCTGYNGIVKAIRRVLDMRMAIDLLQPAALPATQPAPPQAMFVTESKAAAWSKNASKIEQFLPVAVPVAELWEALQDPSLVAGCVPGATLTSVDGNRLTGEISVAFGPLKGRFFGNAAVTYGDMQGKVYGDGQDKISKTRLSAGANFSVVAQGDNSALSLEITYSLRGSLAQFARGPIVAAFANEIAVIAGKNLQAKILGQAAIAGPERLGTASLFAKLLWRRLTALLGKRP